VLRDREVELAAIALAIIAVDPGRAERRLEQCPSRGDPAQ
jgi:hypothetical protein